MLTFCTTPPPSPPHPPTLPYPTLPHLTPFMALMDQCIRREAGRWGDYENRNCRIVFIGKRLDRAFLEEGFNSTARCAVFRQLFLVCARDAREQRFDGALDLSFAFRTSHHYYFASFLILYLCEYNFLFFFLNFFFVHFLLLSIFMCMCVCLCVFFRCTKVCSEHF